MALALLSKDARAVIQQRRFGFISSSTIPFRMSLNDLFASFRYLGEINLGHGLPEPFTLEASEFDLLRTGDSGSVGSLDAMLSSVYVPLKEYELAG